MGGHKEFQIVIDDPDAFLDALDALDEVGTLDGGGGDNAIMGLLHEQPYAVLTAAGPADYIRPPEPDVSDTIRRLVSDLGTTVTPIGAGTAPLGSAQCAQVAPATEAESHSSEEDSPLVEESHPGGDSAHSRHVKVEAPLDNDTFEGACVQEVDVDVMEDELLQLDNELEFMPVEMEEADLDAMHQWDCSANDQDAPADDAIRAFYRDIEHNSKRRRLSSKQGVGRKPAYKLKHMAQSRGINACALKRMMQCGMPLVLLNCLVFLECICPLSSETLTHAHEMFSGVGNIARAFNRNGHVASQFDYERNAQFENILTADGFMIALRQIRCQVQGGMQHVATVCSTWVYLSRASTGRTAACPEGDTSIRIVRSANCMAGRVALLVVFGCCLSQAIIHENPLTPLLSASKYFTWVRDTLRQTLGQNWDEYFTWLGAFGHDLQKPTQLLSNRAFCRRLYRAMTSEERGLCDSNAAAHVLPCDPVCLKARVTGTPAGLKASQAYPIAYGEVVFQEWHAARMNEDPTMYQEEDIDSDEEVPWADWEAASQRCAWPELKLGTIGLAYNIPRDKPLP